MNKTTMMVAAVCLFSAACNGMQSQIPETSAITQKLTVDQQLENFKKNYSISTIPKAKTESSTEGYYYVVPKSAISDLYNWYTKGAVAIGEYERTVTKGGQTIVYDDVLGTAVFAKDKSSVYAVDFDELFKKLSNNRSDKTLEQIFTQSFGEEQGNVYAKCLQQSLKGGYVILEQEDINSLAALYSYLGSNKESY